MAANSATFTQDPVLLAFQYKLLHRLGTHLKELWLFGSRARGDNQNDSDYDVLVVVDGSKKQNRIDVLEEGYSILDEWQQWIGVIVYSPEQWQSARNTPLGWNIMHEGLRLV